MEIKQWKYSSWMYEHEMEISGNENNKKSLIHLNWYIVNFICDMNKTISLIQVADNKKSQ